MTTDIETAYHEAGHAIVSLALKLPVYFATIIPDEEEGYMGVVRRTRKKHCVHSALTPHSRLRMENEAVAMYAGPMAQMKHTGVYDDDGARGDHEGAYFYVSQITCGEAADHFFAYVQTVAKQKVEHLWPRIEATAAALLEHRSLDREQLVSLFTSGNLPEATKVTVSM